MAKEIFPSSFECDCGHQSHFFENTVNEMRKLSLRKEVRLADESGPDQHVIIFRAGKMAAIRCPRKPQKREEAASGNKVTHRQGQFLAFIHIYRKLHRQGPAELDMVKFFGVTPPSVHGMVVKLEQLGLATREPGVARSIRVAIPEEEIPVLEDVEGPAW